MKSSVQKKSLSKKSSPKSIKSTSLRTQQKRKQSPKAKNNKIILLGGAGSGKGTISKKLVNDFGYTHISTGDLLRKEIALQSQLGQEAQTYINIGKLVPDNLVINMVKQEISQTGTKPVLLDGFPRTIAQAEALDKEIQITAVYNLQVPDSEIIERTSARWTHPGSGRVYSYSFAPPKVQGKDDITGEDLVQRPDDKPEAVKQRLESYHTQTFPLLAYYKAKGVLTSFDGSNQPELVQKGRRSDAIYVDLKKAAQELFHV